ncbi:MAG: hypothetical protein QY314_03990 [Candidatus Dojkabacteria bacterium]|nr:MAG: hypothetical protein QY314_03990 [Candidatus Dojkabacteria bacterium]
MTYLFIAQQSEDITEAIVTSVNEHLSAQFEYALETLIDPDIHILESESPSLGVEDTRKFVKKLRNKPFKRLLQIGIIPKADLLTVEAQNALLKELEDHPKTVVYMLGTTNEQAMLQTILSRSKKIYTGKQSSGQINEDSALIELFTAKQPHYLNGYVTISGGDWTKQSAAQFLSNLSRTIREKNHSQQQKLLEHIQRAGELISTNIAAKQALLFLFFSIQEKVFRS